jgi:hypothetical protein
MGVRLSEASNVKETAPARGALEPVFGTSSFAGEDVPTDLRRLADIGSSQGPKAVAQGALQTSAHTPAAPIRRVAPGTPRRGGAGILVRDEVGSKDCRAETSSGDA